MEAEAEAKMEVEVVDASVAKLIHLFLPQLFL
jgi:hypothetical protein